MAQGRECFAVYLFLSVSLTDTNAEGISCALYENASFSVGVSMTQFGDIKEQGRIHCRNSSCCMGIWIIDNGELQPLLLGCFPEHAVCGSEVCIPSFRTGFYKCFCSTDMCNANRTIVHLIIPRNHLTVYVVCMIPVVLALCTCGIMIVRRNRKTLLLAKEHLLEHQAVSTLEKTSPPTLPVDGLIPLQALREEGLTAHLWLGVLNGKGVFIKSFPSQLQNLFCQEWRILNLLKPFHHENIVCLLDAGTGTMGILEHHQLLVLQHYPEGSLRNYLTNRTMDWATACKMAISLARGLVFLHSNIWQEGICKPAIAHRDLSSENILVTSDSFCIISDFGASVVLQEYQRKRSHDPAILNMTGTLRYMSPEMLDGSLNLMSWELALTQADVYSLGLLLWEIFSRCSDLYADHKIPEFSVVFSEELGQNPTLDELRSLVVERKRRPRLPKNWSKNRQLYDILWETLEDCWDPDSEARLSAQCAEQRLRSLLNSPHSLPSEATIALDSGST